MQLSCAVPREAERLEQSLLVAEQLLGHERANADHLVAVVGVGDHVCVLPERVEYWEAVRSERADSARRLRAVQVPLPGEPLQAMRQPGGPHPGEVLAYDELGAGRAVRIDGHLAGG